MHNLRSIKLHRYEHNWRWYYLIRIIGPHEVLGGEVQPMKMFGWREFYDVAIEYMIILLVYFVLYKYYNVVVDNNINYV